MRKTGVITWQILWAQYSTMHELWGTQRREDILMYSQGRYRRYRRQRLCKVGLGRWVPSEEGSKVCLVHCRQVSLKIQPEMVDLLKEYTGVRLCISLYMYYFSVVKYTRLRRDNLGRYLHLLS
jgi:hypothetical protein